MAHVPIGIIMDGVTWRMGHCQHLLRSTLAIREQGGVELADGSTVETLDEMVELAPSTAPAGIPTEAR